MSIDRSTLRGTLLAALVLLFSAGHASAQMDMLPEIFRDLPPELQDGIPADMTFEHYRQMTRNVDFFTMFMSMFVPGYGLYQVERPRAAGAVLAGRVAATGLMGAAVARQWSDIRDISRLQDISEEEFRSFLLNATLFGTGIFLNGMGWALDVLAAYHIAKAEKDYTLYRYGLITNIDGSNEERLRSYLRRTLVQSDHALSIDTDLERYLRAFPDGPAAAEMAFHLGSIEAQAGDRKAAFTYLARSIFAYPEHDYTRAAEQTLATVFHRNRRRWSDDWDSLWSMVELQDVAGAESERRYFEFLKALGELESRLFEELYVQEATYYLWRFPGASYEPDVLYRLGRAALETGPTDRGVAALASVIYAYPDSEFYYRAVRALGAHYEEDLRDPGSAVPIYRFAEQQQSAALGASERAARRESVERLDTLMEQ